MTLGCDDSSDRFGASACRRRTVARVLGLFLAVCLVFGTACSPESVDDAAESVPTADVSTSSIGSETTTSRATTTTSTLVVVSPLAPAEYLASVIEADADAITDISAVSGSPDLTIVAIDRWINRHEDLVAPEELADAHDTKVALLRQMRDASRDLLDASDGSEAAADRYFKDLAAISVEMLAIDELVMDATVGEFLQRPDDPRAQYLSSVTALRAESAPMAERVLGTLSDVVASPEAALNSIVMALDDLSDLVDQWEDVEPPASLATLHGDQIQALNGVVSAMSDLSQALDSGDNITEELAYDFGLLSMQTQSLNAQWAYATAAVLRGEVYPYTLFITEDTVLEADHAGDVVIDADDIVFDCDGRAIAGSGEAGIWLHLRTEVTVTNCVIEGFEVGIWSFGTQNSVLSHNAVERAASQGILLVQSTSNTVRNNDVTGSMIGINLTESHDNTIAGNSVTGTGEKWGIGMLNESSGNHVEGNVTNRTEAGILFALGAHDNTVVGNTSSDNAKGFESTNSHTNSFMGNSASNNAFAAFWLANTTDTTITTNTINGGGFGFVVQQSDRNTFDSNTASKTTDWFVFGISEGSTNNAITNNRITGGGVAFAIYIGANNNTISNNEVSNSSKGFHITDHGTVNNTIALNTIQWVNDIAIHDQTTSESGDEGTGNHYQDNTCRYNGTDSVPPSLCDL